MLVEATELVPEKPWAVRKQYGGNAGVQEENGQPAPCWQQFLFCGIFLTGSAIVHVGSVFALNGRDVSVSSCISVCFDLRRLFFWSMRTLIWKRHQ